MAERKPFLLRIHPELWAELEAWAKDEFRSVNGQIEFILSEVVRKRKTAAGADRKGKKGWGRVIQAGDKAE
jgi:hypothetical protein